MLPQLSIIIEEDFFSITKNIVDIISPIVTVILIWIGISKISRIQAKTEDATFNFHSRFLVHIELLLKALGTEGKSVLYYRFTKDIREASYRGNTPTSEELKQFKMLIKDILNFLKDSDGQVPFSEEFYENRNKFTKFLIECDLFLGESSLYVQDDELTHLHEEIKCYTFLVENLITEIKEQQKKLLASFWTTKKKWWKIW
jgi:hypothetical protein